MKLNRRSFIHALKAIVLGRNPIETLLKCKTEGISARIRDIAFARDAIEGEYDPTAPHIWRRFKPGLERIELTVIGGRGLREKLRDCKLRECEWVVEFPRGCIFGFRGSLSKVRVKRKKIFKSRLIGVVIEDISNRTHFREA